MGMSALGLFVGGGTAHAQQECPIILNDQYNNPTDVGGSYDCSSIVLWTMPNNYIEAFVIAPDNSVWTIWNSSSGISRWKTMGGQCAFGSLGTDGGGWTPSITCDASNGNGSWYRQRVDQGNGAGYWTNWREF
jgi:hypothetical protein